MPNNLIVHFSNTITEEKNEEISKELKRLGNATPITQQCWFLNLPYTPEQLTKHLSQFFTDSDTLFVADATNDQAFWFNIEDKKATRIRQHWVMK